MRYRSNDYVCPVHGRFDTLVPRDEEESPQPCPDCGTPSPWQFPAPMGRMEMVTVVRGKNEGPRRPTDLNTSALADGLSRRGWKAQRRKVWRDRRLAQIRQAIG